MVKARKVNRTAPLDNDRNVYQWRHLIENLDSKLKEFKRVAMRSCETDTGFAVMINLGSAPISSR